MALQPSTGKVKVKHNPADILLQTPWGDAILEGQVEAVGEDVEAELIGWNVTFSRRDGYIINESEAEEYWIIKFDDILEFEEVGP